VPGTFPAVVGLHRFISRVRKLVITATIRAVLICAHEARVTGHIRGEDPARRRLAPIDWTGPSVRRLFLLI
jgi:hypothetical protein